MKYVRISVLMAMSVAMVAAAASCKKEETPKKEQTLEEKLIGTWVVLNDDGTPSRVMDGAGQVIYYQEQFTFREDHTGTHVGHFGENFEDDFAWGLAGKIVILDYPKFGKNHTDRFIFYGDSLVEDANGVFVKL